MIRLRESGPIYVGDSRHLSHRLVSLGFSPRARCCSSTWPRSAWGWAPPRSRTRASWQSVMILVQTCGFVALVLMLMYRERRKTPREATS